MMVNKQYVPYHVARRLYPVDPVLPGKDDDDIVEYGIRQKVVKTGDGEYDFVVKDEVYEVSRVNRQAFIAKDSPDVGVLNILEKVRRSGDFTLLNQTGAIIPEGLQDYTDVPGSVGEAINALKSGSTSFEALKAIFGNVSFEEIANMSTEELNKVLQNYISSHSSSEEKGENK